MQKEEAKSCKCKGVSWMAYHMEMQCFLETQGSLFIQYTNLSWVSNIFQQGEVTSLQPGNTQNPELLEYLQWLQNLYIAAESHANEQNITWLMPIQL